MRLEQTEDLVAVRPDVPRAQGGRSIPAHRFRRLLAHEAALGRVVAEVAVGFLQADEIVSDAPNSLEQFCIACARSCFRRGIQPLARMLAVPVAGVIRMRVLRSEDRDRRTGLVDDELREAAAMVGGQRLPEDAVQLCDHAASTTQRKPMPPDRSLHGAISRYLPC
jgi:hypothetical protein